MTKFYAVIKPVSFLLAGVIFLFNHSLAQANSGAAAQLMQKMNQIQREIASLREQVEQQRFILDTALKSQRDRYLDIDQRLASQDAQIKKLEALFLAIGADASLLSNLTQNPATTDAPVKKAPTTSSVKPKNDAEAYAIASKLRSDRNFSEAAVKFNQFIKDYPNSRYVSNAYYWLGEIYMLENKTKDAERMFSIVANKYADSNKALDSWYKLGLVQARYGNMTKARNAMRALSTKFPNTSAGELAAAWLKRNR